MAREANDVSGRAGPQAAGPLQRLRRAADAGPGRRRAELTRCVKELGFVGALVNGFSQAGDTDSALYYDLPQYRPFWQAVEKLDVPFYLHPRNPLPRDAKIYEGHNWLLGPNWAFRPKPPYMRCD